jgi:signal transduction histidine kinase/CheY-like chemotaxis protein
VRAQPRGQLVRKYAIVFVLLVGGVLLASGLVELYFSYRESSAALAELQREKASGAAMRIQLFLADVGRQVSAVAQSPILPGPSAMDERRSEYLRLLRRTPALTEVAYLDSAGREQLRISRLAMNAIGSGADLSGEPRFLEARAGKTYYGPVYFRDQSEPYMTLAVRTIGPDPGVMTAEVNLKLIWDVVSQIKIGRTGYAYVVDSSGTLVAHPDISLVLQKTELSTLDQVRLSGLGHAGADGGQGGSLIARNLKGQQVLSAFVPVDPPGWSVLVEQPLDEAFASLYASLLRTVVLLLVGLVLSIVASLVLARRMVTPIRVLQAGAEQIGAGALDHRIEVRTGDELQALGEAFNTMTARLRESYEGLEQKVDERTRDLAEALARQTATSEILRTIASSPTDIQPVLDAVAERAAYLCDAYDATVLRIDGDGLRVVAYHRRPTNDAPGDGSPDCSAGAALAQADTLAIEASIAGRAVLAGQSIQVSDASTPAADVDPIRLVGCGAALAVPLMREGSALGAVLLRRSESRPFTEQQIALVETFADQTVIAAENARLFEALQVSNRQLALASQHKSEFLANMSHELRTPLNAIIGFSDVLIRRTFGELNERQDAYLHDVLGSGRYLLSLINDILDLSKIEAGRMDLELGTFSLPDALRNGLTMVRERAGNHGIALTLDVDPALRLIRADERKVKQVVFNLLSNAVKFTPDGGQIVVRAGVSGDDVVVAVRDTGVGIAPDEQDLVFEEFRQARSSSNRRHEGTGLGLALCKRFVELHGGHIWVESEQGLGSTFTFTLPSAAAAPGRRAGDDTGGARASGDGEPDAPPPQPERSAGALEGISAPGEARDDAEHSLSGDVLVIEDDPLSAELLRVHLDGAGFRVAVARDGAEGLELAGQLQPSVIVLDLNLPSLDGWEVLARAKDDPVLREIPIVVVSMLDERGRGFALGAADYLVKPVESAALLGAVRRVMRTAGNVGYETLTVLAVDDDPLALELLLASLEPAGFDILTADGGAAGLELARQARPDLIVLDLMMPDFDGFAVIDALRADPEIASIPVVVLTSKVMSVEEKAQLSGRIAYLAQKGDFDPSVLSAQIRGLCPAAS